MTRREHGGSAFPILVLLIVTASLAGALFKYRGDLHESYFRWQQGPIPEPISRADYIAIKLKTALDELEPAPPRPAEPWETPTTSENPVVKPNIPNPVDKSDIPELIPAQMNLRVPFISQAPKGVWDEIHEDTCEEASLIMLQAYLTDESSISVSQAEERLLALVDKENEMFGYFQSTEAEKVVELAKAFYGLNKLEVLPLDSIDELKEQIARGYPVLVPADGRILDNPFFSGEGPEYHMVLVKGFTATHVITNDPGTKRGADFLYTYENFMDAVHDWNGGDVPNGAKVMIVVGQQ
jgi:hypothetical protein